MKNGTNNRHNRGRTEPVNPAAADTPRQSPDVKLTAYAERLLARSGAPEPEVPSLASWSEWITCPEAAKLAGYSRRQIYTLCQKGFFSKGEEWRQRPSLPGAARAGRIWIKRSALKKLHGE